MYKVYTYICRTIINVQHLFVSQRFICKGITNPTRVERTERDLMPLGSTLVWNRDVAHRGRLIREGGAVVGSTPTPTSPLVLIGPCTASVTIGRPDVDLVPVDVDIFTIQYVKSFLLNYSKGCYSIIGFTPYYSPSVV